MDEMMSALSEPTVGKFVQCSVEQLTMTDIPLLLADYKRLSKLTACNNQLSSCPPVPENLTQLLLRNNKISSLPKGLAANSALDELDLRDNDIAEAPNYLLRPRTEVVNFLQGLKGGGGGGKKRGKGSKGGGAKGKRALHGARL